MKASSHLQTLLIHLAERPLWEFLGALEGMKGPAWQVWPWVLNRSNKAKHTQWFLRAWPHFGLLWGCSGRKDVEIRDRFPCERS